MIPLFVVDAFTDRPFSGNPAAICLLPTEPSSEWMQAMASEMNLAETAFLYRQSTELHLRWFTPLCEVDLCGHATLAAAHILWQEGWFAIDESITLWTKSGPLIAKRLQNGLIVLDFPLSSPLPRNPRWALKRRSACRGPRSRSSKTEWIGWSMSMGRKN